MARTIQAKLLGLTLVLGACASQQPPLTQATAEATQPQRRPVPHKKWYAPQLPQNDRF